MTVRFTLLSLLLALFPTPLSAGRVEMECLSQDIDPPDQAEDCRFLLSHLPTGPILNSGQSPRWSISLPFLPKAHIRHRSCLAQFTLFVQKPPPGLDPSNPDPSRPPVLEVWDLFRAIGEDLVPQCIEKGRFGYGTASYSWLGMTVTVTIGADPTSRANCRAQQREQMELMERPLMPWEESDNVWNYAIYDV